MHALLFGVYADVVCIRGSPVLGLGCAIHVFGAESGSSPFLGRNQSTPC